MSDRRTLQIKQISAHPGPIPGGSRARNAARRRCLQADRHHDLHRLQGLRGGLRRVERHAVRRNHLRQHLPDDARDALELLEPDQVQRTPARRRHHSVAHAQGSVHALRRSRMPARLSRRWRHRAVHQRHRRLPAGKLHRLRVLRLGLPVQHSEVQPSDEESLQVHAVL